jgi:predicted Zn-dependent protease
MKDIYGLDHCDECKLMFIKPRHIVVKDGKQLEICEYCFIKHGRKTII